MTSLLALTAQKTPLPIVTQLLRAYIAYRWLWYWLLLSKEEQRKKKKKTKDLTQNKYMAMGPSGARCQE
jgi:hypothetical protein